MSDATERPVIVIAGAGSVGCFVGGLIAHGGGDVRFLARERIASMILQHGLTLTDFAGLNAHIEPASLKVSTDPALLSQGDIIFVTVKSGASEEMAALIREYARPGAVIISLQNGIANGDPSTW